MIIQNMTIWYIAYAEFLLQKRNIPALIKQLMHKEVTNALVILPYLSLKKKDLTLQSQNYL